MARDVQDIAKELLLTALDGHGKGSENGKGGEHRISGATGMVAGAGAAALAPMALRSLAKALGVKEVSELVKSPGEAVGGLTSRLGESVGSGIGDKVTGKLDDAGGPAGILGDAVKGALPFGGGEGGGGQGQATGAGKGRRMPVQQSVDIGAPLETVYNQWTQFEDWPSFMHRVTRVSQEDDTTLSFSVKIWGKTKEFTAEIETQRPDERVKWRVTQGMIHTGVVSFHELAPNLTRVLLSIDVEPGSLVEKAARGMRLVKRAARGDLHRFKGLVEMAEQETGAWRGRIEDGEVVEEHDPAYDEQREYSDLEDLVSSPEEESDDEDEDAEGEDAEGEDEDAEPEDEAHKRGRGSGGRAASSASPSRTTSRRASSGSSGGGTRGRSSGASKAASSGGSKAASSGGSKAASSGGSKAASSGGSKSASARASKSASSGASKTAGSRPRSRTRQKPSTSKSASGGGRARSRGSKN